MRDKTTYNVAREYMWLSHPWFAFADMMQGVVEIAWILGTIGAFLYGLDNAVWMVLWTIGILVFNMLFTDRVEMKWVTDWMNADLPVTSTEPNHDPNYA